MTLHELYNKYKVGEWPDKGSVHSYIDYYAELFAPVRKSAKNILEIGLMSGESLRMWEDYFSGDVYGIDCTDTPVGGMADLRPMIAEMNHNIFIGDATDPETAKRFFSGIKFDVIIEDAQHTLEQQLAIYSVMKHYMAEGGIYVIEDVQDIDISRGTLQGIDPEKSVEIIDRRNIKGRYDDVLIVIT
jgi:hypothetical protein